MVFSARGADLYLAFDRVRLISIFVVVNKWIALNTEAMQGRDAARNVFSPVQALLREEAYQKLAHGASADQSVGPPIQNRLISFDRVSRRAEPGSPALVTGPWPT
jgi:hypothetical protein